MPEVLLSISLKNEPEGENLKHKSNLAGFSQQSQLGMNKTTKHILPPIIPTCKAVNDIRMRTVIAQPGLRYAQADALIQSLLLDETFSDLSLAERNFVTERILSEIKVRMMEDIVLLETKLANPKKEVFVLQFAIGEFNMVVFDPAAGSCEIYEIKHSTEAVPQQYRHLINEQKCELTQHRFGPITGKYVLYRGEDVVLENGITYRNVEEYLIQL